jgi:hypothetical protein
MSCSGASETGSVPRGCFGQLASTRHVVPPHLRSKSILLSSFLHSSCFPSTQASAFRSRIGRSHRRVGVRGLRGGAFLTCRCECFIRPSCSAAMLHCIPTTRLQRSSVLRPRSCTPLLHCIYAPALVFGLLGLVSGAVGVCTSTILARDLK